MNLVSALLLPLALLLPGLIASEQAAAEPVGAAPSWQGEYFDKTQGGLFLKIALKDFPASAQTKFLTGNIQVTVRNLLKKSEFLISHTPADPTDPPREIWKLPSGKYEITSIVMVDTAGVKRTYAPGGKEPRQSFSVKRHCLANLGLWTLAPSGPTGIAAAFTMVPNTYDEAGRRSESSVAAVIDGFSGILQEKFGGRRVLEGAADNFEGESELRATVSFTRQISMFYRLDLFRHNRFAKPIAEVLNVYDPNLRQCYMDRLQDKEELKGDVQFTFLLSKTTGTMAKLKHTGGTANDPKLAQCMYYQLAQIQFPVPENMVGELTYTYDVR